MAGGNITVQIGTPPSTDPDALREAYLRRLLKQVSRLELSGIDRKATGPDTDTCLNLGTIYTALLTRSTEREEVAHATSLFDEQARERRLSASDQINQHDRLVLLGDPGSGKSTFVKFVAMCLAGELIGDPCANLALLTAPLPSEDRKEQEQHPQEWRHGALLPVIVILRDFAARGLPPEGQTATVKHLWNFLAATLDEMLLGEYVPILRQQLLMQGGLLLLDGLDEVPEAGRRRPQIKQAVEDFAATFHACRIVVTSRTYAYQQQDWRLNGFRETVLAPFTASQIRFFVEHWYQTIAETRGMDKENAQGRAELLKRAIFANDRLRDFAERPLLLTLMASLHAWRGGSLPEKRGELYAEATDLLLDWWERAKMVRDRDGELAIEQPSLTEMLRVGKDRVQQVLNELAFEAHQGQTHIVGTADISEDAVVNRLLVICRNDTINPLLLVKHLSDRAGLLVPHGVGVYTFPHRTFQEYLAACYLTAQQDYPENVARLVRNDPNRWREVLLLAAASAANVAPMIWALAEALCYQNLAEVYITAADVWGALLAGQALAETTNLTEISPRNQSKANKIRDWLVAILTEQEPKGMPCPTVERALAGNVLAQLGDPRLGVGVCENGLPDIVWCDVPAGKFTMGDESDGPIHDVVVSPYEISRYLVTNAQYRAFIKDGGYTEQWKSCWGKEGWTWKEQTHITEPDWAGGAFDLSNHPVVRVSWYETTAFCAWLTRRLREIGELSAQQAIRLPTEAEWEKAARGTDERVYPWGNKEITPEMANYSDTGFGVTSTVGCFPRGVSPYGCEDLAGNVWEWCQDWYASYSKKTVTDPRGPDTGSRRVLRGGGWYNDAEGCRAAYRSSRAPDFRDVVLGFRLLRTPA